MPPLPADLAQSLIATALRHGADQADAMVTTGLAQSIEIRQGSLEHAERQEDMELGLRVLIGQRQACVAMSETGAEALDTIAERAVAMAREAPPDPYVGLADPDQLSTQRDSSALELCDPAPEPDPADLSRDALAAEAAALDVSGVSAVQSASATYGRRQIHLAASNGFAAGYTRSSRTISCVATAGTGTGMERDYCGESRTFQGDLPPPDDIGRRAGERAIARLNPKRPPSGHHPVLFDRRVAGSLIGHLLAAANGLMVARGSSWLRDALGQQVLPDTLSLIEDPHRARIAGSRLFDAEGLPTRRRAIVENGTLTGWTLDLATGRKLGLPSTANAARAPGSPPSPAIGNIALTQGAQSPRDLMADMGTGLWVTSLIGSTINPTTGDYSRGAAGIWVENGDPAFPVNECTIAGNLRDMLRSIIPANDGEPHLSRVIPALLVEGLTIAGA